MSRKFFVSEKDCQKAYKLYYREKWTYSQIGQYFGTSKVVVKNLFKQRGWIARGQTACQLVDGRWSKESIEKYVRLYNQGMSCGKLGAKFGVAPKTLAFIFKERGIFKPQSFWILRGDDNPIRKRKLQELALGYARVHSKGGFTCVAHYISKQIQIDYSWYLGRKPRGHHLDHKYSISAAFYNPKRLLHPCTLKELCHPCNLQYLTVQENSSKSSYCSLTLTELRNEIRAFNAENGDPFKQEPYAQYLFERWSKLEARGVNERVIAKAAKLGIPIVAQKDVNAYLSKLGI